MSRAFLSWVCWFLFLFIIDFTVPFLVLENVPKVSGSFVFWILWIIVAIASMFIIFLRWHDYDEVGDE